MYHGVGALSILMPLVLYVPEAFCHSYNKEIKISSFTTMKSLGFYMRNASLDYNTII